MPPHRDQEVHRHQHHFPEEEEQEEIERREHADDAGERPHQVELEKSGARANLGPRRHHRDDAEHERQRDHHQRQPVHRENHLDAETRNPRETQFGIPAGVVHDGRGAGRDRVQQHARDERARRSRHTAAAPDCSRSLAHARSPAPSSSSINSSRITVPPGRTAAPRRPRRPCWLRTSEYVRSASARARDAARETAPRCR